MNTTSTSHTTKPSVPLNSPKPDDAQAGNGKGPKQSPADQATLKVAQRLLELCKTGDGTNAIQELYADDAKHIEAMEMPDCPRIIEGKPALIEKAKKFHANTTVHSKSASEPLANGDQFTCIMSMDVTSNAGPMAGKRMQMTETALYTVKNDKISEAKFFYGCPSQK